MTPTPDYSDPGIRRSAAARAAMMMKLFDKNTFQKIMEAVDPPPVKDNKFNTACQQAGLNDKETAWLKSYLSQCNQAVYGHPDVRDAASSGW